MEEMVDVAHKQVVLARSEGMIPWASKAIGALAL
jgi:hypothetical protein